MAKVTKKEVEAALEDCVPGNAVLFGFTYERLEEMGNRQAASYESAGMGIKVLSYDQLMSRLDADDEEEVVVEEPEEETEAGEDENDDESGLGDPDEEAAFG